MIDNELGKEVKKYLGTRRQSWLAKEAGVTQSTVSRIIRGLHTPEPDTIKVIARALNVDVLHLLRLAGVPVPKDQSRYAPNVDNLANRINQLPFSLRKRVVDGFDLQLDITTSLLDKIEEPCSVADTARKNEIIANSLPLDILEQIRANDPARYEDLMQMLRSGLAAHDAEEVNKEGSEF